jgi:hypothetical protein
MDLHPPGGPVRSVKDFFVHIGVVTLGILIALGLEQLVEAHHRANLAKIAVAGFRKELAYNEDEVKYVQERIPALQGKIEKAISTLSAAPIPHEAGPIPHEAAPIDYPGFSLDIVSTASWDTAIATQALNELPFDAVTRYAQAYGALRLFVEIEREGLTVWQGVHRFGTDPAALTQDQRTALVQELRHYSNVLVVIDFAGRGALKSCDAALTAPK